MNTFHDLREKLIELYNEALEEYPEPEEEKTIFNPDTGRVEKYVSTEKENYIIEKIKNMEEDYQYKFLSLLALYYFIHFHVFKMRIYICMLLSHYRLCLLYMTTSLICHNDKRKRSHSGWFWFQHLRQPYIYSW